MPQLEPRAGVLLTEMRILRAVLLVPILFALFAGGAFAKAAPPKHRGLDPTYGKDGVAKVRTPQSARSGVKMALTPAGRAYVLQESGIYAFKPNGRPALGFGHKGKLTVALATGKGHPTAITVDRQGRLLVAGWTELGHDEQVPPVPNYGKSVTSSDAFVVRLLPNGGRDVTFGGDGEVETTFGVPRPTDERPGVEYQAPIIQISSIVVDAQDRPLVGGAYITKVTPCFGPVGRHMPFLARLTTTGDLDTSFAGKGYTTTETDGEVGALAWTPGVGTAVLNRSDSCDEHGEWARMAAFDESGVSIADPNPPYIDTNELLAVDRHGRMYVLQEFDPEWRHPVLVRLLPNGDLDPTFGTNGGTPVKGRLDQVRALAVDAKEGPILADGTNGVEMMRFTSAGKRDMSFGPRGFLKGGFRGNKTGSLGALAIDRRGRIYAASRIELKKSSSGEVIQVARFLPGP